MPKSSDALIVSTPITVSVELASVPTSQYQRPLVLPTVARTATAELAPVAVRSSPESVTFPSLSVALQVASVAVPHEPPLHTGAQSASLQRNCFLRHSPLQSATP